MVVLQITSTHHVQGDMIIASIETLWTFSVAYPAAVALGKVLLQTAPERGLAGGHMEAFLRVMRDVRHSSLPITLLLFQLKLPFHSSNAIRK